jgi:hypothetical protein
MITAFSPRRDHRDWKTLYRAAILETDKSLIRRRVAEAEQAVLARGRELFYGSGTREEQEVLEDALYALRAFRTAWEHTEGDASSTAAA